MAKNGFYLAVGHKGVRMSSRDARTWSKPEMDDRRYFRTVAFGNNTAIAAGKNDYSVTKDGKNWSKAQSLPKGGNGIGFITYGNGQFIGTGTDVNYNGTTFYYTDDGQNWTKDDQKGKGLLRLVWGDNQYVAVGGSGRIARSKDGRKWEDAPDTKPIDTLIDVAYGDGTYVGVGLHGLRMSSQDGLKWNFKERGLEGEHFNTVIWTGEKFVAVGNGGTLESPNGRSWERIPNENAPLACCYGDGVFVGSHWKGRILRSTDGYKFDEVLKLDNHIEAIIYAEA
ncbi:sialidase family protein [Stratiformator vulcanicus]|uniref:Ycf48-like protein n=1 Tax=Stratiformator vulcanicus TaxID=2527980 RepID=A0A517R3R5_9PLAN|nr:hypothetical protein [Stratiformator vulcanicus]QDT38535.1 hypothetical protein Pan189_29290 [Stratiformator vulcanicus]